LDLPRGSFAWVFRGTARGAFHWTCATASSARARSPAFDRRGLRNPLESGNDAGRELYARLVPRCGSFPENGRVIVVPDGPFTPEPGDPGRRRP
jgi:hypothetical protein